MQSDVLTLLLTIGSICSIVSYIPQIYRLFMARSRVEDLSIITSCLWVYASSVTAYWAVFHSGEMIVTTSALINATGCMTMLFLAVFHRFIKGPYLGADGKNIPEILGRVSENVCEKTAGVMAEVHPQSAKPVLSLQDI